MKIEEGTLSALPSKPSTGYVGLLAKHRQDIDPSFNPRAEQKKLHGYARALIEALGGKQTADGWSVDLGSMVDISARIDAVAADVTSLRDAIAGITEAVAAMQAGTERLEQQVQQAQEQIKGFDTLTARVAALEQAEAKRVEDSGAKKRPAEKAEKAS
jgi:conjugal transfer/entry exclusion protein